MSRFHVWLLSIQNVYFSPRLGELRTGLGGSASRWRLPHAGQPHGRTQKARTARRPTQVPVLQTLIWIRMVDRGRRTRPAAFFVALPGKDDRLRKPANRHPISGDRGPRDGNINGQQRCPTQHRRIERTEHDSSGMCWMEYVQNRHKKRTP